MKIRVKITRQENAEFFNCQIDDIVEVEFEEYVAAVVASELASGSLEACKAQAVASRTFAASRGVLENIPISDSSATAQAYRAIRYNSKYQNCIEAAKATAGQVLWYGRGYASTVYTASNGGRTISSQEKWGGVRAYLPAQDDPWDGAEGQNNRWGHGVGMSQRGAKYAAKIGFNYRQILEFYYPHTILKGEYGAVEIGKINEKAEQVVKAAESALGYPYVFGAWGEFCTPANRRRRARADHPTIVSKCPALNGKGSCDTCKYKGSRIYDCRGFTRWCLQQAGLDINGGTVSSQYNSKTNWVAKGSIKEMPNVVCCVFQHNSKTGKWPHTGLHVGDGKIIHCQVGVQTGSTSNKAWTHYAIPVGLYTEEEIREKGTVIVMPILRKGSSGEEVKKLQELLNGLGFDCGVADGKFGEKTRAAVVAYQTEKGLIADGIVGNATWAQLLPLAENEKEKEDQVATDEAAQPADEEECDDDEDIITTIFKRLEALEAAVAELKGTPVQEEKKKKGLFSWFK